MKDHYQAIYLSPHLDDAALSCGGQISELTEKGETALVVTIMAGNPVGRTPSEYAQSLHQRWQLLDEVVQSRRTEDVAACHVMGADWQHWDFLDCIYRVDSVTQRPYYTSNQDIFGEIDPAENALVEKLSKRMAQLPSCEQLFLPLTLGHHVDHQLTRQAAECCFSTANLLYYEDYPYADTFSAEQQIAQEDGRWVARVVELTEKAITTRINAIQCFKSQISTFFEDQQALASQVRAYINAVGGERLWSVIQD
ncbi:MAG: PIG-L family deacetylase [Candidatus Promineifilaceae bacterium]